MKQIKEREDMKHHMVVAVCGDVLHLAPLTNPQQILDVGTGTVGTSFSLSHSCMILCDSETWNSVTIFGTQKHHLQILTLWLLL